MDQLPTRGLLPFRSKSNFRAQHLTSSAGQFLGYDRRFDCFSLYRACTKISPFSLLHCPLLLVAAACAAVLLLPNLHSSVAPSLLLGWHGGRSERGQLLTRARTRAVAKNHYCVRRCVKGHGGQELECKNTQNFLFSTSTISKRWCSPVGKCTQLSPTIALDESS
uniref:Uncharacterized protein n=1 Tax=Anopheles atroparvus TaxID=41427 RepID=A0AAG5DV12_ANOAO